MLCGLLLIVLFIVLPLPPECELQGGRVILLLTDRPQVSRTVPGMQALNTYLWSE